MATIKERYGKQVIVNLLGTNPIGSKESEALLSQEFQVSHSSQRYLVFQNYLKNQYVLIKIVTV